MGQLRLLEREEPLGRFTEALAAVQRGHGRLVLVIGEAGIGKSTFLHRFAWGTEGDAVLTGMCDPLPMPTPLEPFHELAADLGPDFSGLASAGSAWALGSRA